MKYRKPFAIAASAAMLANAAVADTLPTQPPTLDVTLIQQDLRTDPAQLFVPAMALLLVVLAVSGGSGSPAPIVAYR